MNNNDHITQQLTQNDVIEGNINPKKLEQLLECYEKSEKTNSKIIEYLDYLATNVQHVCDDNVSHRETINKIIKHSDYIVNKINREIKYFKYLTVFLISFNILLLCILFLLQK